MIYLKLLFLIAYLVIHLGLAQVDEYQEDIEITQNIEELQHEILQNLTIPILDEPCKDALDRINICELSIISKDEVISFLERDNTAVEIKLKLVKNELNVAKLNFEQQKITLEAKIFDFEEKIKQLQKELSLTNSLLLESRKSQRKAQEEVSRPFSLNLSNLINQFSFSELIALSFNTLILFLIKLSSPVRELQR